ncbi:unnamed protein product [Pelagomonas calceolata]|uniref:Uncharacterized protein n=2 Tax=Pelagomonas calceolata TaxID=35677 RepID=A0A8J2STC0_9STRA|nr:unnamed protein product [Pelagomonas calceolata]
MTAAPPEPRDPKDMATTAKKPKGVEVFVRLEETDKEHRFALRCTLPSRWLGRKSLRSLLDTFFDAYERARPSAPHARRDAALWGDASRSQLDLDSLLSEDLGHERTLWVRFSSSPEFFGTPKTNTALIEYVPRILTRTTREELRERHEKNVQDRAQRVLELFAVPREASVVDACRRVLRDEGTSEGACEHIATKKIDIHTIKDCGDDGRYAESSASAWNRLQGFLPEDLLVGGFVPVRRESKVVAALYGRRWVCRPRFAGKPSGDPSVVGRCLGLMHRCARTYALHSIACASMELRPRPFAEQLRKDCDFACAKLAASDIGAEYAKLVETNVPLILRDLAPQWVHANFTPSSCRQHVKTRRVRVDNCEGGREHCRLWDLYHLFVWDFSKRGLDAGTQAFPVALRAYFKHCDQPPTRKEAALLVPVFLLRTGLLLAECVDELERDDLDVVLRARKSGVDVDSFRGVGAPPLMKREERVAILERRQKTLLRVWRTLYKKRDWLREIFEESGPKLLETSATLKLLPPSESAIVVLKSRAEEDALVAQRTAELGGGFWARVKAGRECRAPTTIGCVSAVSQGELLDVLEGRLAGSEVAPLKELARSLKAGKEKVTVKRADGVVGGVVLSLRRESRRVANVQQLSAILPRLVVQPAVDGLVEGDLERHLREHPDVAIDYDAWAARASKEGLALLKPRRGEVARAASHCQAWRLCTTDHLLVLEDGVEAPPDLADAVALLLSEVPEEYDLLYLCVPERYRVDEKGEGRVVRASVPSLSAYVVSRRACETLIELCRAGLDRSLGEAVAAAGLVTYAARAPPVVSSGLASAIASTPEFCPLPEEE